MESFSEMCDQWALLRPHRLSLNVYIYRNIYITISFEPHPICQTSGRSEFELHASYDLKRLDYIALY